MFVFRISTPGRDAGRQAGVGQPRRDAPAFVFFVLFVIFVFTVGPYGSTGIDALETEPKAWCGGVCRIVWGFGSHNGFPRLRHRALSGAPDAFGRKVC